jgi:hypothetical protein
MKYFLLLTALIGTTAYATGYLQNSDFATRAAITGAGGNAQTQLLQTGNISNDVDTEALDTSIARWDAKQATIGSYTAPAHQWLVSYAAGVFTSSQPAFSDISGSVTNGQLTNASTTVNGQTCTLGGTCTITVGSGTVTSVALTTPAWLTVGGSPVTTSGTLAITGTSEPANQVLASPNGSAGAMTPRALVAADIPALSYAPLTSGTSILYGNGSGGFSNVTIGANLTFSGGTLAATGGGGGSVCSVLTKTAAYSAVTGDFSSGGCLLIEMNCSTACTLTLPAASNFGYEANVINIGTVIATVATAGSDTFGSSADQTWTLIPGGSPQSSNKFISNGGSRWDGF